MPVESIRKLHDSLRDSESSPGYVLALLLAISVSLTPIPSTPRTVLVILAVVLVVVQWLRGMAIPKVQPGRMGIVVVMSCESADVEQVIRSDFILPLRARASDTQVLMRPLEVVECPKRLVERLVDGDPDYRDRMLRKFRAHLMVIGRAKKRRIGGENRTVIEFGLATSRVLISGTASQRLKSTVSNVFPWQHKLAIREDGAVFELEVVSCWIERAIKYIISVVYILNNDAVLAQELLHSLYNDFTRGSASGIVSMSRLAVRVRDLLLNTNAWLAGRAYERYVTNQDPKDLAEMREYVSLGANVGRYHYPTQLLAAALSFLDGRDIHAARKALKPCKCVPDACWRLSDAFLSAYEGKLMTAYRKYNKAAECTWDASVPLFVEEFILMVMRQEPEKRELYLCLALINALMKGDTESAHRDCAEFLESVEQGKHEDTVELVRKRLMGVGAPSPPRECCYEHSETA